MSCRHGEDTRFNQRLPCKRFPIVQETKRDDGTLIIKKTTKSGYPVKTTTITKTKDGVLKLTTAWKDGMILQTITEDGVLKKTTTTKFRVPRKKTTNDDDELEKTSNDDEELEKITNDDELEKTTNDEELEKITNVDEELEQPALSHNTAPLPMPLRQKKVSLLFNSSLIAFSGWAFYRNSKMIFELFNSSFNKILEVIGRRTEMSE